MEGKPGKGRSCGSASGPTKDNVEVELLNAKVDRGGTHQTGSIKANVAICRDCGFMTFYAQLNSLGWAGALN